MGTGNGRWTKLLVQGKTYSCVMVKILKWLQIFHNLLIGCNGNHLQDFTNISFRFQFFDKMLLTLPAV